MTTSLLVPAPILIPLAGAAVSMATSRWLRVQRIVSVLAILSMLAASIALLVQVRNGEHLVVDVGDWAAPTGITLVVDTFAALLLTISAIVLSIVLFYALGQGVASDRGSVFTISYLMLAAGVNLAYTTGDLFNLFVAIEITLAASYVLISLWSDAKRVRNAMTYIVINLVASTLLIVMIGVVYAATGTVSLAELSQRMADVPDTLDTSLRLLLLLVFGIKAGLFPLFFWLPDAYPAALTPVTAIFAGLLTKVGIYAIIRTQTLLFPTPEPSAVVLWIAGLTMTVGVLGALAQNDIKRILSFHIVSQVGYMLMGVGLFTIGGITGAIFYMVHHIPVKTGLFLAGGLVEQHAGTSAINRLGGMRRRAPLTAALFAVPALSIAGLPPFSGFVAKLGLVRAGVDADQYVIVAVSLAVSLLTLMSMLKIWTGAFWGEPDPSSEHEPAKPVTAASTALIVLVIIGIGASAGWIWDLSTIAAENLLDPTRYVEAVLSP